MDCGFRIVSSESLRRSGCACALAFGREEELFFSSDTPGFTRGYSSNAPPGLCAVRTIHHSLLTIHYFPTGTLAFNSSNQFSTTLIWQAPEGRKKIAPGFNPGNLDQSKILSALP